MIENKSTQPETQPFQAEVSRLLDIVVHALYSQREIFLRELISNAADACDRRRYAAQTGGSPAADKYAIHLIANASVRQLTVSDNGIGMDRKELVDHLGTIARSGTKEFLEKLSGDSKKDMNLIGQFGVGFYSAFMVADKVEVVSRKAGGEEAWRWTSDGRSEFTVEKATRNEPGTDVLLHLKEDAAEFLEEDRLKFIVETYSNHIPLPVYFGEDEATKLNRAAALWMRPKSEITDNEYREFYRHVAHAYDEPSQILHWRAEGKLEYTGLLFVPSTKPYDLYDPRRMTHVKLYVRRVFITESAEGLLPPYLRFLRGVIDSEDLPLNVSREMLQNNPVLARMKNGITARVLSELRKLSLDAEKYLGFWDRYGSVIKEGLYDNTEHRDDLLKLFRAPSSEGKGLVSFQDYIARMPPTQDAIYYITGEDARALERSPQLEGFRARGIEVLLLSDAIDIFWLPQIANVEGKKLKSVTQGDDDLDKIKKADKTPETKTESSALAGLITALKSIYGDKVKDVRASSRLTGSPVCLVAGEGEIDMQLERLLRQNKALNLAPPRILEINPSHALIARMAEMTAVQKEKKGGEITDLAWLLLDQARLLEGEAPADPQAFAERLTRLTLKAVA